MRRVMLFYNPHSGPAPGRTRAAVEQVTAVFRRAGLEAVIAETTSASEAGQQAKAAIAQGYDTVFACGGDGTAQDLAQGLVGNPGKLGVIPLGTANVLANDLGISRNPVAAAQAALLAVPMPVSVGRVACRTADGMLVTRYFLSVAGVGQDGYIFHQLGRSKKRTFGIAAYFLKALQVWLTHRPLWFSVTLGVAPPRHATQILAVRLHNFGNVLRDLAPGASLLREDFRVVVFQTSSRWSYLLSILRGMMGGHWKTPAVTLEDATQIRMAPESNSPVYVEADGELVGQLPAEISVVPNALTLLVPPEFASRQGRLFLRDPAKSPA